MEEFCKSSEDSRRSSAQDNEGMTYFLIIQGGLKSKLLYCVNSLLFFEPSCM